MRNTLRDVIPSMFHRRLLLLAMVAVALLLILGVATARLTTGQSFAEARSTSEAKLASTQLISTRRGAILDRNGRVLAHDEPGWEVAVHFNVITGEWAGRQAIRDAKKDRLRWESLGDAEREQYVGELRGEYERQVEEMFAILAEVSGDGRDRVRERRDKIIHGVNTLQDHLWRIWQRQKEAERGEPVPLEEVSQPIAEAFEHHVIVSRLSEEQRLTIERFIAEGRQIAERSDVNTQRVWREVELRRRTVRQYPMESMLVKLDRSTLPSPLASSEPIELRVSGVGVHLIGLMRETWSEDVEDRPFRDGGGAPDLRGYRVGDQIGRSGIELSMEDTLRGARGLRRVHVDSQDDESMPVAGRDVVLSIDILLQAHIQAIMSPELGLMRTQPWHSGDVPEHLIGNPLNGAAVVIDIASGDILAAVTMPAAPRALLEDDPALLWEDPINEPMVNRAISRPYPPGSTVKPLVLVSAITDGVLGEHERIDTPGYLWPTRPMVYRDWYWKKYQRTRGEIDGVAAVKYSSNPFFGILAQRLMDQIAFGRMLWWYEQFGMGQTHGIGLPEEVPGAVGPSNRDPLRSDVEFMAIGQGPVSWTPLHAVTAYARLVSGNMAHRPRLIVAPELEHDRPPGEPTALSPAAQRMATEGMREVANESGGTAYMIDTPAHGIQRERIFNVQGVTIMAKSGTADPGSRHIDLNGNREIDPGEVVSDPRDHAWVVALVQPEGAARPTHAIAVVVEYAGSGGHVSGPIVNQIVHALQHHQYLAWPPVR
ncbi:MAG: penicillin-binding transpeptidase domain-containing protein [Planctomycetota bacterium]